VEEVMAQHSGFFESRWDETIVNPETGQLGDWDIKYYYDQFSDYFGKFFGNGVYYNPDNCLKVLSTGGMSVQVKAGWAFVNGYWYELDADTTLNVPANSTAYTRTDSVALRWSLSNREITLVYLTDTDTPVRSDSIYDLIIATIQVESGVATVLGDKITDTRTDQTLCGIVRGLEADAIDTETLFAQYDAIFNEWFDGVKNQVTGDLAIRLQLEFDQLNQNVDDFESDVNEVVSGIQTTANSALNTITNFVAGYFVLDLQTLTFVNNVCEVSDSRITNNSLIDVYFTAASMEYAEAAEIVVDSQNGKVVLTATYAPLGTIQARIGVRN
jgi:hypothetical protein